MKNVLIAMVLILLTNGALAQNAGEAKQTADIKVYRVLTDISGPLPLPAMDPAAEKDQIRNATLAGILTPAEHPESVKVGGLELSVQGPELSWGGQPEPNRPDIFLLTEEKGLEFKLPTLLKPVEGSVSGAAVEKLDVGALLIECDRLPDNEVNFWLQLRGPDLPQITERGAIVARGARRGPPMGNICTSAKVHAQPEQWTCMIFAITCAADKPAGSLLVFLKTHGEGPAEQPPLPQMSQYTVDIKFIEMPESGATMVRSKYELLPDAVVSPDRAEAFRMGYSDTTPKPDDWLNSHKEAELLSAPRITLTGNVPVPPAKSVVFKLLTKSPVTVVGQDIGDMFREYSPSLRQFFETVKEKKPGVICDLTTVYDEDPETGDVLRNHYGIAAGLALEPVDGTDTVKANLYFNVKTRKEKSRGLLFWKQPPLPTYQEHPATLDVTLHEREVVGLMLPGEDGKWLLFTACLTKAQPGFVSSNP